MISENSLRQISDIFCGDTSGFYSYKSGPKLVSFLIGTLMLQTDMVKDFRPDGHMCMISLLLC